jgi:hypothetical protein
VHCAAPRAYALVHTDFLELRHGEVHRSVARRSSEDTRFEVECLGDRRTGTGSRSADGGVSGIGAPKRSRAPRGSGGAVAEPRLPSQGSAGGQARRGLGRGGSPDTRSAGLPRLGAPHSPARGTPGGASARMASLCSGIWSASRKRHCPRRRATPVIGPREATRPSSNGSWQAFYQGCGSTSPPPRQCSREPTQERLNEPLPDNQITR